jgi:hypothetical protein
VGRYYYGGDLRVDRQNPVQGALVGVFPDTRSFFLAANLNWRF